MIEINYELPGITEFFIIRNDHKLYVVYWVEVFKNRIKIIKQNQYEKRYKALAQNERNKQDFWEKNI